MRDVLEDLLATSIRLHSLYQTALALCSVQDLQELVNALLPRCITAMDVTAACLISRNEQMHLMGNEVLSPDRGFLKDLARNPSEACSQVVLPSGKSALVCHIVTQDASRLGTLIVVEKEASDFDQEDVQRLSSLATITATALENVYQYEDLLRRTRDLEQGIRQRDEEVDHLRREVGSKYRFENIIGRSPAMKQVYALMEKAIDSGLNVLLNGETGTGKEVIAKAIHYSGPRRDFPWREMNCGAVPRDLVASTLFGHSKGAFTGADEEKPGLFESAQGGTVILDEIGEMPLDVQPHLLRVLQEHRIQRLGETRLRDVDVRVIAVTNRNLEADVRAGRFREDLYYRLSVFPIPVPPLRERVGDIPLLAEHFLREVTAEPSGFGSEVSELLRNYPWPGNVRELRNEVQRAAALAGQDVEIQPCHLSPRLVEGEILDQDGSSAHLDFSTRVLRFQRRLVEDALQQCEGNRTHAAKLLGMHRPGLVRLIKRLKVDDCDQPTFPFAQR